MWKKCCLLFPNVCLWCAGRQGDPEAAVRSDCVSAGPLQHWGPTGPYHLHLRHHRHDHIWACQAPGTQTGFRIALYSDHIVGSDLEKKELKFYLLQPIEFKFIYSEDW